MAFAALVRRDLALSVARPGALLLPVLFFLMVAIIVPFAVGPDAALLARIGPGTIWVAALLASLLPVETLYAPDAADGTLDQLVSRGVSLELLAAARLVAHWLAFALPLLAALPIAGALLDLDRDTLARTALGLLIGTPALAGLAGLAAALTVGGRGGGLAGLLILPLAVPILIFGTGMAEAAVALKLLGAASLFLTAVAPLATGAALRTLAS